MGADPLDIGIITDEISRDLEEALQVASAWGVRRLELREGQEGRFPGFTKAELTRIESAVGDGSRVTAVSPGLFKGPVEDAARREHELGSILPRTLELAGRLGCPTVILFGFTRRGQGEENRLHVLRAFEQAAEQAGALGLTLAVENEPDFWIDRPEETVALLRELDHPALRLNWDPANLVWGGGELTRAAFETVQPFLRNVHVKDYTPEDPDIPWRPVGQGVVPWRDVLAWITRDTPLEHVTLETHCEPLKPCSEQSLGWLRETTQAVRSDGSP